MGLLHFVRNNRHLNDIRLEEELVIGKETKQSKFLLFIYFRQ
jgi:hypothetical protein